MKIFNDCIPCIVRGSLDAARLATADDRVQLRIMQRVLQKLISQDMDAPPPVMARHIQQAVSEITGVDDPYKAVKQKYNRFALSIYDDLKSVVDRSGDPFDTAARLAIAGNIIDFGAASVVTRKDILKTVEDSLSNRLEGDAGLLKEKAGQAGRILWLADNAGEIVFDKLLLGQMDRSKVVYAVRGGYAQNDATMEDAVETGVTDMVTVMDTGVAVPGTLVEESSGAFREVFDNADLIISKGQGNYETLDQNDSRIFFLFKVKCPIIAAHSGYNLNDTVILNHASGRQS